MYSFAMPKLAPLLSLLLVTLMIVSGIGYAGQTTDANGSPPQGVALVITSMAESSGPSYTTFTVASPLPSSTATATVGPLAPGDSVVVSYTVKNTGNIPASLSTLGLLVTPSGSGFTGSYAPIPSTLSSGASFTSTFTVTFGSGLGNSYEGKTATITLAILGTGITTTTTCKTTSTSTHTVTSPRTVTVTTTKTLTDTTTKTATVTTTMTMTKGQGSPLDATALWTTTSSCTTITVTITAIDAKVPPR